MKSVDGDEKPTPEASALDDPDYKLLFEHMQAGVAYQQMIFDDEGKATDFVFLAVNKAFEAITGLRDVVGKRESEVVPGIQHSDPGLLEICGRVALTQQPERVEYHVQALDQWYETALYAPQRGYVVSISENITAQKRAEQAQRKSETLLAEAERAAHIGGWEFDVETLAQRWTSETFRILEIDGVDGEAPQVPQGLDFIAPRHRAQAEKAIERAIGCGEPYDQQWEVLTAKGNHRWVHAIAKVERVDGKIKTIRGSFQDITARKQAEEALRASEEQYRNLIDNLNAGVVVHAPDTSILVSNRKASELLGLTPEQMRGKAAIDPAWCFLRDDETTMPVEEYPVARVLAADGPVVNQVVGIDRPEAGDRVWVLVNAYRVYEASEELRHVVVTFVDITTQKRAAAEQERLAAELQQAQKLESVGRLAGGVAHDFNNMLSVILGHAEMALEEVDPSQPLHADLLEIQRAARHSADLTRQLLAFARKQTVAPRVLDLNETVGGMLKMLRRLIGEDIDLVWQPGINVPPIKMDPSQIDQLLANLCVNARDAIEGVGKLTIETAAASFDKAYCASHAGHMPGEYVMLAVSDDGCGMDKETQSNLFEPFFTTKDVGKGTGLGLATVYGIVKQNGGFIHVYSELERGSTFRIYLPAPQGKDAATNEGKLVLQIDSGHETVLLVEDEPAILRLGRRMLESLGYTVLVAGTPGQALRVADQHPSEIHLLMTDVVMPEMNGRELAKQLLCRHPGIKRLFMSGYTANVIAHHGVLDEGVHFIQKPFSKEALAAKVREVLDAR